MLVFTKDRFGNPGHPTRRHDQIRKLLKRKEVRIIGGGLSGKPIVAMFLNKVFDVEKAISRQFARVIDPGYQNIGYALCEVAGNKLIVLHRGKLETRIPDIKGLMTERRAYRRQRRHIERFKSKRHSRQLGQVMTKFKSPRYVRSKNKTNATLQHGINVHLNLYGKIQKLCPVPVFQSQQVMEDNCFDVRTMTWGTTYGKEYQVSPRENNYERKCIVCGSGKYLHKHHLVQKKKGGTEVKENKVWLCKDCHRDIHTGLIFIPIEGVKQWRALGTVNAITGVLRKYKGILHVSASDMAAKRRELGLPKEHGNDAVAAVAALYNCTSVDTSNEVFLPLKQFRRHNRSRTHALRDRLYKLNGKIAARNRNKRTDQKEDSLSDTRAANPGQASKFNVYPGVRLLKPFRKDVFTVGGDIWAHSESGKRFVATGVASGNYLFSPGLRAIVGRSYVKPTECVRLTRNEGMVIV